eukprot:COSAG01_NODE_610_length_14860_cov_222.563647_4_plen_1950_part_00
MPQPRRALQLPPVPVSGGRHEQKSLLPSSAAPQEATSAVPRPPQRSSPHQRTSAGFLPQSGRIRSHHQDVRAVHEEEGGGGLQRSTGELAAGAGVLQMMQEEITKRDAWLRQKDELLRAKDEQMVKLLEVKDEQLRAKDEQMREQLRAKDEQISGFMASMSPSSHISAASQNFPASPVPYNPPTLPSPPVASPMASNSVAATAEQRRYTRHAHLRAAEEAPRRQSTGSRDHCAECIIDKEATGQDSAPAVALSELRAGGPAAEAALTAVLEHGLEALESIPRVPRKHKKAVLLLCEQVESTLEELDTDQATQLVEQCEAAQLAELHRALGVVSSMGIGRAGMECVEAVESLLGIWKQCSDVVTGAGRILGSVDAGARMRGLETLQGLPRVVLAEAVDAEVALVPAAGAIGLDEGRSNRERVSAFLAVFTLGLRNTAMAVEAVSAVLLDSMSLVVGAAFSGRLHGREGLAVVAAQNLVYSLMMSFASQLESTATRAASEKLFLVSVRQLASEKCTAARCREYLAVLLELSTDEDTVLAAGAALATFYPLLGSGAVCAEVYVASQEYIPAMLASLRRQKALDQSAAWWKERSARLGLDAVLICGPYMSLSMILPVIPKIPSGSAAWEQLLGESIHMLKINQEAALSAQPQMIFTAIQVPAKVVGIAAREQSRRKALLASGVVDALLWTTAHDYPLIGTTLAEHTASASVTLVGRNEGGLTLTRETVDCVLDSVHQFWDTTSTHWRVTAATKAPVTKLVGRVQPIVDMVIADANKPFVLQHKTALDDLVLGLLVDEAHPRRSQEGAAKLQETCALVLQNLALSDVGKGPLRSHSGVMAALRSVASGVGGLSDQARRYAEGALFELDETVRRQAKEAAAAAAAHTAAAASTEDGGAAPIEHVMLSYNWDHQDVVKRVNLALKARDYTVWIDVEKMQGSTVEAMAAAVEEAAVVCYGISNAYKESVNCRLEAQYAFQQKKDMVPLMLEEGYSPNGWLGMLLGVRLWYGFYGSVLVSAQTFESKVEELCRELGERGTRAASQRTVNVAAIPPAQHSNPQATLTSNDDADRINFVDGLLECASRMTAAAVGRKDRKQLTKRIDSLLEDLDTDDSPPWLASAWTEDQAAAVIGASDALWAAEKTPGMSSDDVANIVSSVLAALEKVVESHVDNAEALLASMQNGESDQVIAVLEHGLMLLETLSSASTRKARKAIDELCEQVEHAIESLGADDAMEQLASCEISELMALAEQLKATSSLNGNAGDDCMTTVRTMLETLTRCRDPVLRASRRLMSEDVAARMRGLETLRGLPRVYLAEPVAVEVAAAAISVETALDVSRDCAERLAATMSVFALTLRNGAAPTIEMIGKFYLEGIAAVCKPIFTGELSGREGVELLAAFWCVTSYASYFGTVGETAALRGEAEKQNLIAASKVSRLDCTRARYAELLPTLLELSEHQDIALASGTLMAIAGPIIASGAVCAPVIAASREYPDLVGAATLALIRRIDGTRQLRRPAAWWKERSNTVHLDSACLSGIYAGLAFVTGVLPSLPPHIDAWEELLAEAIHMCKINKEAELSAQPQVIWLILNGALRVVVLAAREQSRHKSLLVSGVVDGLLWTTGHDSVYIGTSLAEFSATATVALIGRNEGGLTLTRETVDTVLDSVHLYWDTTSTHWRVKAAAKAPVKKLVGKIQPIVDMVIADTNKPFVLEHPTAIDDLLKGLLVDHNHPRRTQDGAGQLQEICALVLQNLALSDVGKGPLRSHPSVIRSLRAVASAEGGMTEKAQQYAAGALFELDEVTRQKAKDAAVAAKTAAQTDDGDATEHIMLSYNWGHQDVIKRINTALKSRGYVVWIDIEKMQGSTVEAMADAVEDAAVVCFGISQAYKESANCRMEAQYAYQQEKDMVPLMLEEGYRAKGWLGMILGMRLWYGFYGTTLANEGAFEGKVEELCRELGERGLH